MREFILNKYMNSKTLIYALFALFLGVLSLGLFAPEAYAQFSGPYYYYDNTYPYQSGGANYFNNYSPYPTYQNEPFNFPNTNSGQACPPDYVLMTYNGQHGCYKFLNQQNVSGNFYPNYSNSNYNPTPSGILPNCAPGDTYSRLTGQRCDDYYDTSSSLIPGCLPSYTYSIVTGQRCDDYNTNYNNGNLRGGDGTIRNFDVRDGNDTSLQEGDNDAEVMEIRFDVRNGDIRLDRIRFDFEFTGDSRGEDLPWNTFDEIRLLYDGSEIDRMNADDRDDWDKESNDVYSITFSSLNEIIREGDRAELTLEIDIDSNISGANNDYVSWEIFIPDRGLRARDGNGDTVYAGDDSDNVSIDIDEN
jgi:hypothetical protein